MDGNDIPTGGGCPVMHHAINPTKNNVRSNRDWWPNQLNLKILHQQAPATNPMGDDFDYRRSLQSAGP